MTPDNLTSLIQQLNEFTPERVALWQAELVWASLVNSPSPMSNDFIPPAPPYDDSKNSVG